MDESEFVVVEECTNTHDACRKSETNVTKGVAEGDEAKNSKKSCSLYSFVPTDTASKIYVFTNKGNMFMLPVSIYPEARMKEAGKSLNALVSGSDQGEEILNIITKNDFAKGRCTFATREDLSKRRDGRVRRKKIQNHGVRLRTATN